MQWFIQVPRLCWFTPMVHRERDKVLTFRPGSDIAIANAIANYLIVNDKYDHDFVADHVQFKQGTENIGNATDDGYSSVWKTFMKPTTAEAMHRRALGSMLLESRPAFRFGPWA